MEAKRTIDEELRLQDEFKEHAFKYRKRLMERTFSMLLRVTFLYNDKSKTLKPISGPESLFDPTYTGNHIVIFENQLKTPSSLALIDHTLGEFLNLRKINFKDWKVVDIDHYMKGNTYFPKQYTEG